MPIFFIHFVSKSGVVVDHDGSRLLSLEDAKSETIARIRRQMTSAVAMGKDISSHRAEIRNSAEELLATVRFRDALSRED